MYANAGDFYYPGPGFNNKLYDEMIGSWGASIHGEINVQSMTILIGVLDRVINNFNDLMAAGKADDIAAFVGQTKKVIAEAKKSGDPMVQALAMRAEFKLAIIELGLEKGELSPDDIKAGLERAKELEAELGGAPGPIVDHRDPEKM